MVQAQANRQLTQACQRDVVARRVNPCEAIALFEVAEAVVLLLAISKPRIHQESHTTTRAGPDGLCYQRVLRGFISVADHRHDVHQARLCASLIDHDLDESNELVSVVGADEDAVIEKSGFVPIYRLDVFSVMRESPPLSNGTLVVDFPDSLNQRVIERRLP